MRQKNWLCPMRHRFLTILTAVLSRQAFATSRAPLKLGRISAPRCAGCCAIWPNAAFWPAIAAALPPPTLCLKLPFLNSSILTIMAMAWRVRPEMRMKTSPKSASSSAAAQDVRPLLASRCLLALPVLAPPCMRRASSAFLIASKSAFLALLFPPAKGFVCNLPIVANVTALF